MSEPRFNTGGYIKPGKVYFAPSGTENILTSDQWQELGTAGPVSFGGDPNDPVTEDINQWNGRTIRTRPPVIGSPLTFTCIPPKTRREKRERRATLRLMFGHWPTHWTTERRQLIHNGRKP